MMNKTKQWQEVTARHRRTIYTTKRIITIEATTITTITIKQVK